MTKATVWNSLKATGYDAKQLKAELGVTYAQVTKEQLQQILEGRGVNENLGSQCGGGNTPDDLITEDITTKSTSAVKQTYRILLTDIPQAIVDKLGQEEAISFNEVTGNFEFPTLEPMTEKELENFDPTDFEYNPIKLFEYEGELLKLKSLSRKEFMSLVDNFIHVEGFGSYYCPTWKAQKLYLAEAEVIEIENCVVLDNEQLPNKLQAIQDCFTEAGNYHFSKMQLTSKLQLFTDLVNYSYLMECYLYLLGLNENVADARSLVHQAWFTVIYFLTDSYINQPLPPINDYVKLLTINHENKLQLV